MTHRERILTALEHKTPDRCPMQISFTPEFADRLRQDMDIKGIKMHNPHGGGNTYQLETTLGEDMLLTSVGWANSYYSGTGEYTDEWGIKWRNVNYETRFGRGSYTEIREHPLAEDSAVDAYKSPDPDRPELYRDAQALIDNFKKEYWIVGVTVTTIFETAWALRGLEKLIIDIALNPEFARRILEIPYNYHKTAAKKLVSMGVDMVWIGDDVGTQTAMLFSPETWRRVFKPMLGKYIAELRNINRNVKIAYHSDGYIYPIIPDLIEIGVDVLNPIQPACMNPEKIKKEFGDKLCFWGTLDEQYTLPFGKPEDVEREVRERIKTVGKNGGLILAPTHHVQLDTPLENFWVMVKTIKGENG